MADIIFNIAKGMIKYYFSLPAANDAIICIPLEATGLEADATLGNYDDVAALLAASNNEQTTMGRKTITSFTATVDDTNDRLDIDTADIVWTAATGNAIGALLFAYDPDTTGGTDSTLVPISKHTFAITPDGSDVTATIATAGLVRAA